MDNLFKKNKNKDVFKIFSISCSVLLLVVILNFYVDYKYLSIVNNFYSKFNIMIIKSKFGDKSSLVGVGLINFFDLLYDKDLFS